VNAATAWNGARAAARTVLGSQCGRWAVWLSLLYVVMDLLLSLEMGARGLLSPGGAIHPDAVVIGLACIAVRIVGRFAVPALLAFGLTCVVVEQLVTRRE
jgi:hypothetical protein